MRLILLRTFGGTCFLAALLCFLLATHETLGILNAQLGAALLICFAVAAAADLLLVKADELLAELRQQRPKEPGEYPYQRRPPPPRP